MFKILLLFVVLIAGIIFGPVLAGHQGYVFIQTDNWDIETSVTSLVIMFVLLQLVLLLLGWCYRRFIGTGSKAYSWFSLRKRSRARKQTRLALMKLAEGDFKQVEKLMSRNADYAEQPVVNYLLAAEAAQQRGDEFRVQQHLERASELADTNQLPVDITRVRILLAQNENHAARTGVDELLNQVPRHPEVLRLAETAYIRTEAWQALLDIIPSMQKIALHTDDELEQLRQQAYIGLMGQKMSENGCDGLKNWWKAQPRKIQHDNGLRFVLAEHLIECNDPQTAQTIILDGIKRHYDERLILLLPRLKNSDPDSILKVLNSLIKQHGPTPLLNSTVGQIAMQQGQWAQAETAFRNALKQRPDVHDFAWLADVLDKQNKSVESAKVRKDALLMTLKKDSVIFDEPKTNKALQ